MWPGTDDALRSAIRSIHYDVKNASRVGSHSAYPTPQRAVLGLAYRRFLVGNIVDCPSASAAAAPSTGTAVAVVIAGAHRTLTLEASSPLFPGHWNAASKLRQRGTLSRVPKLPPAAAVLNQSVAATVHCSAAHGSNRRSGATLLTVAPRVRGQISCARCRPRSTCTPCSARTAIPRTRRRPCPRRAPPAMRCGPQPRAAAATSFCAHAKS